MLSRDQILGADDLRRERVEVPEWGGHVFVGMMTGTARDAFEASIVNDGKPDLSNMRAKLAVACMVDEAGRAIFGPGDVTALAAKSATALDRVVKVAQRLNRLGDAELEEMRGN